MGDIYIKPSHRGRLTELKERTGKSEAELYNDGNPAHRKMVVFARNARKWNHADGGLLFAPGGKKNSPDYTGIINSRVKSAYSALRRNGYGVEDAWRLAGLMTAHSISETGWINPSSNNFGGHKSGSVLRYSSPETFWDYHISNLNEKWPGWDRATTPEEYDEAINHTSLGLYTSDKYDAYKKSHPNTYIYAPAWENDNYLGNMKSIYRRVSPVISEEVPPILPYAQTRVLNVKSPEKVAEDRYNSSIDTLHNAIDNKYITQNIKSSGGVIEKMNSVYNGDVNAMLSAVRKAMLNKL